MTPVDLALLSSEQKGFVCSVRMLEGEMQGASLIGDQVKTALAELLPPAALFGPEITTLPYVRRELRKWLDSRGANLQQQSSHHFVMTLATSLNKDAEDRVVATQMASALVAESHRQGGGSSATTSPSPAARGDTASSGGDRTAHNIAMRFRDPSVKFSGNLGESWMEYVAEYQQVARDYDLSPSQCFQYLRNLLRGDATRFYLDKVQPYATSFTQAVDQVSVELCSGIPLELYLHGGSC
ncbi:hypothetical protein BU14_0287s0005 [Porphyra umbilicalis]|uniref:Uncharacterized protein n=1 Tax=Porphyra umbilicalis TaxID=2786 RepID=A0A1X6P133_PORUM|nr:hypothetical protein BU14_0287s0005 [Porphyra umbilicalis]|eukprot:OSX74486.1 hypothetical protein BU14_0287s0005 [Porphyra umbilicalis]